MKKQYIFSIAALALLTAACSSDEMALTPNDQSAPIEQKIPFTAVISGDAASTRVLAAAEDGKTIAAKWEKDEEVALIHGSKTDVLKVDAVDATTGAATISGDITSPTDGESVFVVYVGHDNMAAFQEMLTAVTGDIAEEDISEAMNSTLTSQDGTLKGISDNFDFRLGRSTFKIQEDGSATFASEVQMPASYAIWKLSLTTDGTTALKVKQLLMQRKGDEEAHAIADLGTETTSSEFYIAFIPSAEANAYTFEATDADDKTYSCTPTVSSTLSAGKFYRSTLKMEAAGTYRVYTAKDTYTDENIPSPFTTLTGTVTSGDLAEGTYVVSGTATCDGTLHLTGDVNLILKDGASLTVTGNIFGRENTLNIYGQTEGTGELSVTTPETDQCSIVTKNLNIHGGKITCSSMKGIATAGAFTIYNGIINTTGSDNGILAYGPMNVYGGEITAKSTNNETVLFVPSETNENAKLTIAGGKVTATNTDSSMGIMAQGEVIISGGTVEATGGDASDYDGGYGIYVQGSLTISGSAEVIAKGGAGDGETSGGHGISVEREMDGISGGDATISGGTVTATSGSGTAAIYIDNNLTISGATTQINATGGDKGEGVWACGTINISGGDVTAKGGAGGGRGLKGTATISGGTVTAIGGDGIKSDEDGQENGAAGYDAGDDGTLTVTGGTLTATGGAGNAEAEGSDGYGIDCTIKLGDGIKLYTGPDPNPSEEIVEGPATPNLDELLSRYVIIK